MERRGQLPGIDVGTRISCTVIQHYIDITSTSPNIIMNSPGAQLDSDPQPQAALLSHLCQKQIDRVLTLGTTAQTFAQCLLSFAALSATSASHDPLHQRLFDDTNSAKHVSALLTDLANEAGPKADCAVVSGLPHSHTRDELDLCLAILRDRLARTTLLFIDYDNDLNAVKAPTCCTRTDLTAMGMRCLGRFDLEPHSTNSILVFGYNIIDYKPVPDWFNADHWANPARWNKDRW